MRKNRSKRTEELVAAEGGPAAFARLTGAPIDTAKNYSCGRRQLPDWLCRIVAEWIAAQDAKKS